MCYKYIRRVYKLLKVGIYDNINIRQVLFITIITTRTVEIELENIRRLKNVFRTSFVRYKYDNNNNSSRGS